MDHVISHEKNEGGQRRAIHSVELENLCIKAELKRTTRCLHRIYLSEGKKSMFSLDLEQTGPKCNRKRYAKQSR